MICRINITGRKIWVDNDNAYKTRPTEPIIINLLRDGKVYKTAELDPHGDGIFQFKCLPVWNGNTRYNYQIDEPAVPRGYEKKIQGFNIENKLVTLTITVTKVWDDNHNESRTRPDVFYILLLQNDELYKTRALYSMPTSDKQLVDFDDVSLADSEGNPFVYTVDEQPIDGYSKKIDGFVITNKLDE